MPRRVGTHRGAGGYLNLRGCLLYLGTGRLPQIGEAAIGALAHHSHAGADPATGTAGQAELRIRPANEGGPDE